MSRLHPVSLKKYKKFLTKIGCHFTRQRGDHLIYHKEGLNRPIVFPIDKEVPVFYIQSNNITLNITSQEFLKLIS